MNLGLSTPLLAVLVSLSACAPPGSRGAPPSSAVGARDAAILGARQWQDERGAPVAILDYRGAPFVVTEVYTSCQVRCPMTLAALHRLDAALRARGVQASFVLVTLDPRTDTPERLRRFKASHDLPGSWHLLTGTEGGAAELARYLDTRVARDDGHIDHDVQIAMFDARGRQTRKYSGWSFDADDAARAAGETTNGEGSE